MLDLTPGNLITHLRKLEDAGYLKSETTGNGRASPPRSRSRPRPRRARRLHRRAPRPPRQALDRIPGTNQHSAASGASPNTGPRRVSRHLRSLRTLRSRRPRSRPCRPSVRGPRGCPVEVRVRDDELRRRRAPRREILGRVRVADEGRVVAADERAVQRRAHTLVRLRADDDETADGEVGEDGLERRSPRTSRGTASRPAARPRRAQLRDDLPLLASLAKLVARVLDPDDRDLGAVPSRPRCRRSRRRCRARRPRPRRRSARRSRAVRCSDGSRVSSWSPFGRGCWAWTELSPARASPSCRPLSRA